MLHHRSKESALLRRVYRQKATWSSADPDGSAQGSYIEDAASEELLHRESWTPVAVLIWVFSTPYSAKFARSRVSITAPLEGFLGLGDD
jgi:hypothetical protein